MSLLATRGSPTVDGAAIADDRGADLPPDGGGHVVIVVTDRSVQKWRRRSGQSELNWLRPDSEPIIEIDDDDRERARRCQISAIKLTSAFRAGADDDVVGGSQQEHIHDRDKHCTKIGKNCRLISRSTRWVLALAFHPNCEVATKIRQRRPPILLLASGFHNVQSYSHVQSLSIRPRRGRRPPLPLFFPSPPPESVSRSRGGDNFC